VQGSDGADGQEVSRVPADARPQGGRTSPGGTKEESMFDVIGDAAAQQVPRTAGYAGGSEKDVLVQKAERLREARPVEQSGADENPKSTRDDDSVHNRTRMEGGQILIEKYDESGRLLKVTPPGYLPLSEIV
jgi:hypothetical protein